MPKIVDHQARRQELVQATWTVIARHGLSGATMRQIAEEAGYSNGALARYFPDKASLIGATYALVVERTNRRIEAAVDGLRGMAAVELICWEILPSDSELVQEARLVVSFWEEALKGTDPGVLAAGRAAQDHWRRLIRLKLGEALDDGELRAGLDLDDSADFLLTQLFGAHITALLDERNFSPDRLRRQLRAHLALLAG